MLGHQQLTKEWAKRFQGLDQGFWISLNSKIHVNGRYDSRIPGKFIEFDGMVGKFIDHMNEHCYGRKYLRKEPDAKLTCLVGYEVGNFDGLVHCHIVAAHDGKTNRSVSDIKKASIWKWSGIANTKGSKQFVDVSEIGDINDRIWYLTKQATEHQRMFGESNLSLY
jgi:hypothetical protein